MIEERIHDGRCGYPLCANSLNAAQCQYLKKKSASIESICDLLGDPSSVSLKQPSKFLERSLLFCSNSCSENSSLMERRFDSTSPYVREIVQNNKELLSSTSLITTVDNATADSSVIDSMLSVMYPTVTNNNPSRTASNIKSTTSGIVESNSLDENTTNLKHHDTKDMKHDPPVTFTGGPMNMDGELSVVFEEGIPKPISRNDPKKIEPSYSQQKTDLIKNNIENDQTIKQLPPKSNPTILKARREEKNYPSNVSPGSDTNVPVVMHVPPAKARDHFTPRHPHSSASLGTLEASEWTSKLSNSIVKGPATDRLTQDTAPVSGGGTGGGGKKKVTFASILESMRQHPHSREDSVAHKTLASKPSEWSAAATTAWNSETQSAIKQNNTMPASFSSIELQASTATAIPLPIEKEKKALNSERKKGKAVDSGIIVERMPKGPMSASAILLKQEPTTEPILTEQEAGQLPQQQTAPGVDTAEAIAARAIEGYVQLSDGSSMAVARTGQLRVAPRTLLQGLSYNPLPSATPSSASSKRDEGDQSTDSEEDDDDFNNSRTVNIQFWIMQL